MINLSALDQKKSKSNEGGWKKIKIKTLDLFLEKLMRATKEQLWT